MTDIYVSNEGLEVWDVNSNPELKDDPRYTRYSVSTDATTYKKSSDGLATVSNETFWKPVDANTPRGTKVWLINKSSGSATTGQYTGPDSWFTHWFPLPRFRKDEDET